MKLCISRKWKDNIAYSLFIFPALGLFALFFIIPFVRGVYYSFTDIYGYNKNINFIGLANYLEALQDETFFETILVTLKYTFFVMFLGNMFSLLLALALDTRVPGRNVLRTVFFLPNVMSLIIVGFVWTFIYGDVYRSIASVLTPDIHISWLGDTRIAIYSIGITAIWQSAGYAMIIYIAGLQNISPDVIEAAVIDGASARKILYRIKLPLITPVVIMNLILAATSCLKAFDFPMAMTSGGPGYATTTVALHIYTVGFKMLRTGYATALSILLFLIIALVTIILMKVQEWGEKRL